MYVIDELVTFEGIYTDGISIRLLERFIIDFKNGFWMKMCLDVIFFLQFYLNCIERCTITLRIQRITSNSVISNCLYLYICVHMKKMPTFYRDNCHR